MQVCKHYASMHAVLSCLMCVGTGKRVEFDVCKKRLEFDVCRERVEFDVCKKRLEFAVCGKRGEATVVCSPVKWAHEQVPRSLGNLPAPPIRSVVLCEV